VKYIVEATVDPLLREAVEGAKDDHERVEAVLALNVLDPSMGSGHFLVEVTERIARFLVEMGVAPDELAADGEVTAIDIDSEASKLVDLSSLEVEGLPVDVSPAPTRESRAV
jgi:hypothetical protein